MKNTTLFIILAIVVVGIVGFMFMKSNTPTGNVISQNPEALDGSVQRVVISEKDANYYPNEIKVKSGQPVSLTLDSSVKGCLRSFNIRDLGVSKYAKTPSETIDFTPTKKGTFTFACAMGMGYGTIIVE